MVHFHRSAHFFWSDQNVLFHLTKLLSPVTLFCILLTRITKPNARWLGPGLSNRSILFRFRNFKAKLDVLNKASLDSSCVLVIMKFFGVTFLQKRRNCSKTERFDLLKTCNLTNTNFYFSFVKSYYFKCYNKTQTVINLCTRGSVKGSYKRIKTISTNSKTSWRIKTQGFNSELYFTIKTQTNNINNNKTLFIKIVLIPFQTLFWPWDQTKTRKKEVFSFSFTTGLQAQEWPRYWLESKLKRITHVGLHV